MIGLMEFETEEQDRVQCNDDVDDDDDDDETPTIIAQYIQYHNTDISLT